MTLLMAAGVKKSLVFNNVLNALNLAVWVFVMTAGLFYVDSHNWSEHKGFLPYGWSGVLTGAATCFYAFIGFDIIATTGEEATNPKRSIPLAIVTSLVIILIAYVTSSMMITLIGKKKCDVITCTLSIPLVIILIAYVTSSMMIIFIGKKNVTSLHAHFQFLWSSYSSPTSLLP